MHTGPKIKNDNLVFGYDTGYGVADNNTEYRFNKGKPTETFDIGTMVPTDASASFTSGSTYQSNLAGSAWDWSYYPNSNVSSAGGMEWHPNAKGPGFKGAWLMKKRPGGNGESNFSGTAPGAITSSEAYTVSVWVKTTQANCFRIHLNTTKNGSSYWGYASSRHTGGGEWERLSVTLPAGSGNTSINTIRFQALGTTVTADAYCRNYQVEKNTQPTPFLLSGTRSNTASLIDLKKTNDIDVSNVTFESDGQPTFDGTDDKIEMPANDWNKVSEVTVEIIVLLKGTPIDGNAYHVAVQKDGGYSGAAVYGIRMSNSNVPFGQFSKNADSSGQAQATVYGTQMTTNKYYHLVYTRKVSQSIFYQNGEQKDEDTSNSHEIFDNTNTVTIGEGDGRQIYGNIPVVKIYNKVLTPAEIKNNFNAYKNRFDL